MLPRPEKHVFVCVQQRPDGHPFGSCSEGGAGRIFELFLLEQKARQLDGKVQVSSAGCLGGPCSEGPTVIVYPDAVKYHNVRTPEDIAEIFEAHLIGGEPVARLQVASEHWARER